MAHVTTFTPAINPILRAVTSVFTSIWDTLVSIGETSAKMQQFNALADLSDAELAKRGLRRDEIAHYVFVQSAYL
ncbi:MAG: hypothetical protein AB8B51_06775 [Sedimentitalea sp.]